MDYSITPVKQRSLVLRLALWTAATGTLAGGGYGAYRYAAPGTAAAGDQVAGAQESAEAAAASDRLLAALPPRTAPAAAESPYTTPFDAPGGRYGAPPTLPPAVDADEVATPRSAAAVDPAPVNPFQTMPVGGYSGRYGAAAAEPAPQSEPVVETAAVAPPVAPAPVEAAPEPAAPEALVADVTRGQEPVSVNPLRAGSARREPVVEAAEPEQHDGDARAAFRDEADAPLPVAAAPLPVSAAPMADYRPAGDEPAEPTLAASAEPVRNPFGAAAPLPVTATPAYGGAPLPAAYGNAAAPSEEPVAAAPTVADAYAPASAGGYADAYAAGDAGLTPTPGITAVEGVGRPGERSLEGLQTPSLTVQKLAPPEVQVGKRATFAVRVQNNGSRTAHHVIVTDEVPQGAQLIGTAPKAAVSGAQVVWDLGTLGVGEERIVEMELLPTDEGELGSVATVSFAAQASAKARSTRPQLALRLSANPRVMIGDQQIVVIEVSNPGTGDATGVMLLETVPDGLSHEAGPALEFEIGTLRPGESRRLELVLQADAAGVIDNVMVARADANLQVQAGCQFEVIAPALAVTVEGPQKRFLERPATYMVNVDNPGTASARDVQLVTQLPPGMKFVSANNMGEYDAATHSVYWSLAELPANQRGTVELTALPVEAGEHTLQIATRAQQGLEDRAEARVTVEGLVALSFEVQDVEDAIEVGSETAYDIRVTNQGSKAATNVQVVAIMPPGLRAQSPQGESRYQVEGDRVVFAPVPQLAPKSDARFRFRVLGLRPGDQRVTLQLTTDEIREPIVNVESTQVYSDQ